MRANASTEKSQARLRRRTAMLRPEKRCDRSKGRARPAKRLARPGTNFRIRRRQFFVAKKEVLESGLEKISGGPLKKGEFGRRNRSKAPRGRRGGAADVPKGRRGATLCKFTTYSRGPIRRDPAHLFSSAWQAGESKRADRKRRRLYFYSRSAISRSAAHLRNGGDTSVTVVTSNFHDRFHVDDWRLFIYHLFYCSKWSW